MLLLSKLFKLILFGSVNRHLHEHDCLQCPQFTRSIISNLVNDRLSNYLMSCCECIIPSNHLPNLLKLKHKGSTMI